MSDESAIINALDAAAREWHKPDWEELAEKLEKILRAIYDGINDEWHPAFREDLLTDQDRTLLVKARTVLAEFDKATKAR